jgi:hypothetical protein
MSVVSTVTGKAMESMQLQKAAKAIREQSRKPASMNNLFVNQQPEHSKSYEAKLRSLRAMEELCGSKRAALRELLGTEILSVDTNAPDGRASDAMIRNRVAVIYRNQRDKMVNENNDASAEKDKHDAKVTAEIKAALAAISTPVKTASVSTGKKIVADAPAAPRISIRV